jgi:hypothetical protein
VLSTVAAWKAFKTLIDLIGSSNGSGPTSSTVSQVPTQTVTSATGKPTTSSTPQIPLPNIVVFTENMNKLLYNVLKATTIVGGGVLLEDMAIPSVSWYAFYGLLTDTQADFFLNTFPLTAVITPDVPGHQLDDPANEPQSSTNEGPSPDPGQSSSSDSGVRAVSNHTRKKRAFQDTDPALRVSDAKPLANFAAEGIRFFPFHLQWLSNLWAKTGLTGLCKYLHREDLCACYAAFGVNGLHQMANLTAVRDLAAPVFYDNSEQRIIDVFVIDTGFAFFDQHDVG